MIPASLQFDGALTPGMVLISRALAEGRSSLLFRTADPIDRGRSVVLQTKDGQCLECVTIECTPEEDYHVLELRCMGDSAFLRASAPA
jgi:hypothetical protein